MQQSLDDADALAAALHAAHQKTKANAENMLEQDNAVNIFKIKLIATLDQKMELVTKRREELRTTKKRQRTRQRK